MPNPSTTPTPSPAAAPASAPASAMALFRLVFDTVAAVMVSMLSHLRTHPIPTTGKTFRQVAHCLYALARVELSIRLIPQRITPVQISRLARAMRQFSALTGKIFDFVPFMPETSDEIIQDDLDAQALIPPGARTSPRTGPLPNVPVLLPGTVGQSSFRNPLQPEIPNVLVRNPRQRHPNPFACACIPFRNPPQVLQSLPQCRNPQSPQFRNLHSALRNRHHSAIRNP